MASEIPTPSPESFLQSMKESAYGPRVMTGIGEFTPDDRSTLHLLDAIAGLAVSQARGEVYATGLVKTKHGSTVLMAGNTQEVPMATQRKMNEFFEEFSLIAGMIKQASPEETLDLDTLPEGIRAPMSTLGHKVIRFTLPKFSKRLEKRDRTFDLHVQTIIQNLTIEKSLLLETFNELVDDIRDIRQLTVQLKKAIEAHQPTVSKEEKDTATDVIIAQILAKLYKIQIHWDLSKAETGDLLDAFDTAALVKSASPIIHLLIF